jgi:membrane protease YdiL (CAAX protease family)
MRRLLIFVRSIIPSDPFQLFFLAGSILLLISPQMRGYPLDARHLKEFGEQALKSWRVFSVAARISILFAGGAGLFICFWPGVHLLRRILGFVLLPAGAGIFATCARFVSLVELQNSTPASVFQSASHSEAWVLSTIWSLGPGVHMSLLGFALVVVFLLRLVTETSTLPLSLARGTHAPTKQDESWNRILVIVWFSIPGMVLFAFVAGTLIGTIYLLISTFVRDQLVLLISPLDSALATACLAGVAAWEVGKSRWTELLRFIRPPEAKFGLLGVLFPVAIWQIPGLIAYLADRIQWTAFEFGNSLPPWFGSYFHFPAAIYAWYFLAAGFEEIIWRGYLQPRFVQRFGLMRGLFLLGLAWSAFHFHSDFQQTAHDYQVLLRVIYRVAFCTGLGYVLGWLTLSSRSIWPAILVHGLNNIWAFSAIDFFNGRHGFNLTAALVAVCWGLLAIGLFRFWPPSLGPDALDRILEIGPEPTT